MNTKFRPQNRIRASANAVIESKNSSNTVVPPANTNVLMTSRVNGSWSSTACMPCRVQCRGSRRAGSPYRSGLVRNATPSIHRNGTIIAMAPTPTISHEATPPTRAPALATCSAAAARGPRSSVCGGTDAVIGASGRTVSVGIAVPRHPQLHCGNRQDNHEQNPGERAGISHLEFDETLFVQVHHDGLGVEDRSAAGHRKDQVEELQPTDRRDQSGEQKRGAQGRQRHVAEPLPGSGPVER